MAEQQRVATPPFDVVKNERERLRRQKENRRSIKAMLEVLIVVAAIAIIVATRILPILQVTGSSMTPTLEEGEIVVLVSSDDVKTGDIIGFYYQNKILIKRVIGLPGDYIDIEEDGTVLVNGEKLEEPYVTEAALGECDITLPYHVPEGKYFVMGDQRSVSIDSRSTEIGSVSEEQIIGKVTFRIWPFDRITSLCY